MRKANTAAALALGGLGLVVVATCLLPLSLWFAWGMGAGMVVSLVGILLAIEASDQACAEYRGQDMLDRSPVRPEPEGRPGPVVVEDVPDGS